MIQANVIEDAFGPLIKVFEQVLIYIHSVVGGSWGWAIIGLTIVIRVVTLPITLKQFRGMAKMQIHAPELKKLQAKYKDDKQRLSEETMKNYKENGVNPLASCLPMLVQLPVFVSLIYMLRTDLKKKICGPALKAHGYITSAQTAKHGCSSVLAHSGAFLFIPDITAKAQGWVLGVLVVLYVGSMVVTSYFSTAAMDRNQRLMMLGLPFVFTIFILQFAAGLLLYWITTNMTQIPLQWFIRRRAGTPPPLAVATAGASTNGRATEGVVRTAVRTSPAARSGPPRQPPRKRKKRSGRRR